MADEQEEVLDLTPDMEVEDQAEETGEETPPEASEEFQIELEGEEAVDDTPLIKTLRDQIRAKDRELAEHRKATQPKVEVGQRPTLETCEYDEERFEREFDAWRDRKATVEAQTRDAEQQANVRNEQFQRDLGKYRAKAAALPVQDFEAAESTIRAALPDLVQSAIITYADDPAKVVYALYKHPAKLAQLASETDPVKAILAFKEMEGKLKVTTRKPPPPPMMENVQRGSAPMSRPSDDKKMKKLEEEARRTGNRTELIAFKEQLKAKEKTK